MGIKLRISVSGVLGLNLWQGNECALLRSVILGQNNCPMAPKLRSICNKYDLYIQESISCFETTDILYQNKHLFSPIKDYSEPN